MSRSEQTRMFYDTVAKRGARLQKHHASQEVCRKQADFYSVTKQKLTFNKERGGCCSSHNIQNYKKKTQPFSTYVNSERPSL